MFNFKDLFTSHLLLVVIGFSAYANAQTLEEIVVTAQKREVSLQDVPLSVSAIGEHQLERLNAVDFASYARSIPNLSFTQAGGNQVSRVGNSKIAIRGIVSPGLAGDRTTSYYIDETPITSVANSDNRAGTPDPFIFDTQRIEVLRGPQGTLYGSRSMGGLIKVVTNKPVLDAFEARSQVDISTTNSGGENYNVAGVVNIPIVEEKLAIRLMGAYRNEDGYIDNVPPIFFPAGVGNRRSNINDVEVVSGRAMIDFQATDNLLLRATIWGQTSEEDNPPLQDSDQASLTAARPLTALGNDETVEFDFFNFNFFADYDLGFGTVISSTTYWKRNFDYYQDLSGLLGNAVLVPSIEDGELETITQEIRFESTFNGPFQLLAGVFYTEKELLFGLDLTASGNPGLPPPLNASGTDVFGTDILFRSISSEGVEQNQEELAFFGTVDIDVGALLFDKADKFLIKTGLRWVDYKEFADRKSIGLLSGLNAFSSSGQKEIIPSVEASYRFDENKMAYIRYAEGFRPGFSQALFFPPACAADLAVRGLNPAASTQRNESDSLSTLEGGVKTEWFDNRLQFNASGFYTDWSDIVVSLVLPCGFAINDNAAGADIIGFEVELQATPMDGLLLQLGVGYTDATFTGDLPSLGVTAGDRLPITSKWTLNLTGEYNFPILDKYEAFARIQYSYATESVHTLGGFPIAGCGETKLKFGLNHGSWEPAIYVDNLTNERCITSWDTFGPSVPAAGVTRPQTIGLVVRKSWD